MTKVKSDDARRLPPINRRQLITYGLGAGAAAVVAACTPAATAPPSTTAPAPKPAAKAPAAPKAAAPKPTKQMSDTVTVGWRVATRNIDPHASSSVGHFMEPRLMFDALVTFDDEGKEIIPQLAAEWKRIDPATMEFKLRDDVKFSNGDDFTAETVKVNLERVLDTDNPIPGSIRGRFGGAIAGAEVVNSTTVRILSTRPDPVVLNRLTMVMMASDKLINSGADFNVEFAGTGSFQVTDFKELSHLQLEAFEGSWRGSSPIKSARIQGIPEQATLIAALQAGDIDIAYQVTGDRVADLKDNFTIHTLPNDTGAVVTTFFTTPETQHKRVRQAFNYAVDKEAMLTALNGGIGRVMPGQLISDSVEGYNPDIEAYPYDPDKARALLQEAGATSMEPRMETATTIATQAEAVGAFLEEIGVSVTIDILEPIVFITRLLREGSDADMFHRQSQWWRLRTFHATGQHFARENNPHFDNEEYRTLYAECGAELDTDKRIAGIQEAIALMHDEAPAIFLTYDDLIAAHSKKIAAIPKTYDRTLPLWKIEKEA